MNKLNLKDMTQTDEEQKIYQQLSNQEKNDTHDLVSIMAIQELLNKKKLKTISRVKFEQVQALTRLYMFDSFFKVPFLKKLADEILQLQISVSGLGRKELVQLVQQRDSIMDTELSKIKSSKDIFR